MPRPRCSTPTSGAATWPSRPPTPSTSPTRRWQSGSSRRSRNVSESDQGVRMTLPVSTSGSNELVERCCGAVFGGVVGDTVEPAAPDHADPGAGQHADGVRVVLTRLAGVVVDLRGPGAGVP